VGHSAVEVLFPGSLASYSCRGPALCRRQPGDQPLEAGSGRVQPTNVRPERTSQTGSAGLPHAIQFEQDCSFPFPGDFVVEVL
jgi:hypothetical protein